MKRLILAFALVMLLGLTTSAYAINVYTLDLSELATLTEMYDYPNGVAALAGTYTNGTVWYEVTIASNAEQFRYILLGDATPPVMNLTSYDRYELSFENTDNNDEALVSVYVKAGGTRYLSSWVDLSSIPTGTASLDLATLGGTVDLSNIEEIGLGLAYNGDAAGGAGYQGDTLNIKVSPIPEPTSMLLLGIGLIGLAGGRARKRFMA